MNITVWIWSIVVIFLWGLGSVSGKFGANASSSGVQVYFWEFIGTCSIGLVYFSLFNNDIIKESFLHFNPKIAIPSLGLGILWGLGTFAFCVVLNKYDSVVIVPLTSIYPLIHVFFAIIFLNESMDIKRWLGVVFAIAAIILLTLPMKKIS